MLNDHPSPNLSNSPILEDLPKAPSHHGRAPSPPRPAQRPAQLPFRKSVSPNPSPPPTLPPLNPSPSRPLTPPTTVTSLLYAFGDVPTPLPETVKILDEIVTDFIIETCHAAASSAAYARRQKIKVDDFKFAIRRDERMLGRVLELLGLERELREARRQFDADDDRVAGAGAGAVAVAGVVGEGKKRGARAKGREEGRDGGEEGE